MKYEILSSRKKKRLEKMLQEEYGLVQGSLKGIELLDDGGGIWAMTREILEFDWSGFNIESMGIEIMRRLRSSLPQ